MGLGPSLVGSVACQFRSGPAASAPQPSHHPPVAAAALPRDARSPQAQDAQRWQELAFLSDELGFKRQAVYCWTKVGPPEWRLGDDTRKARRPAAHTLPRNRHAQARA